MWAVLNVESAAQLSVERHELKEEKGRQERERTGRKGSSSWHLNRGNNNKNDNERKVNVVV